MLWPVGKFVLAFDVGRVSEIVANNKTGLLVVCKDEKDLAENIQKLLMSNKLHDKMILECRTYATSNVSRTNLLIINHLELFSRSLVEQRTYPGMTTNSR